MRILFLTSRLPYPPFRGDRLKIFNIIKRLSRSHDIALLSFVENADEEALGQELNAYTAERRFVRHPRWRAYVNCAGAVLGGNPYQVAYYRSSRMSRELAAFVRSFNPQVIHTHLIRMAEYTVGIHSCPRVLDMTDAVSLYLERRLALESNSLMRIGIAQELRRMRGYEDVIARFDRAYVCSDVDRAALRRNGRAANVSILPNGVDLDSFAIDPSIVRNPQRLIFTGNMTYFPNIDGARFLVHEILPLIHTTCPDAILYIVGQNPPASIRNLAGPHVVVTGFVEDIRAEYLKSTVALSPIRFGAGTLNKILEPLVLGVPVVAMAEGMTGLGIDPERDIVVARSAREFAEAVVRLLSDGGLRDILAVSTPKHREQFGWDGIVHRLEADYQELIGNSNDVLRIRHDSIA